MKLTRQQTIDILKNLTNTRKLSQAAYKLNIVDSFDSTLVTLFDVLQALEKKDENLNNIQQNHEGNKND